MAYTSNPGRRRRLCHYRKVRLSIVIIEIAKLTAFSVRRRPVPARCSYACLPYGRYSLGSGAVADTGRLRSEEHTSELQSLTNLVCRLLLEKKNTKKQNKTK